MNGEVIDNDLLAEWLDHCSQYFPSLLQERPVDCHKGSFGTVAVIGGAQGMSGAIVLAGQAALKTGCGRVWLGFCQPQLPLPYIPAQPELMLATATYLVAPHGPSLENAPRWEHERFRDNADEGDERGESQQDSHNSIATNERFATSAPPTSSHWAVGCGMGQSQASTDLLETVLRHHTDTPLLLDADALNLLAQHPEWTDLLAQRNATTVITPHPAEAARLLDSSPHAVQANREEAAMELVERYFARVVLKGHQSIIAAADEPLIINQSGNPGLATAGSGDVLSGMIISLLAQGLPEDEAVAAGVWLHGAAADLLALQQIGPIGLVSSEIADAARFVRNRLVAA